MQFLLSFLHIFIRDFLTLFMHNNIVFWLSAQAKMIISPVVVWLHAGSGGKKFELHLTFGRTKSSVQEVNGRWSTARSNITFRQIICWWSRGTTMLMEVKLHYFHGHGSTTAVAVKNQVKLKKLRIAKFFQKWKKNILLPRLWYYHDQGSSVILLPSPW